MIVSYWTKWTISNIWVSDCISLVLVTGIDSNSNGLKAMHSMLKMASKTSVLPVTQCTLLSTLVMPILTCAGELWSHKEFTSLES